MNKLLTFPPFYFFFCIILVFVCYIVFPTYSFVKLPINLIGIIPIWYGLKVVTRASKLFEQKKTTFYLDLSSELVMEGDFKYSRNPMYLGSLILITGLAFIVGNTIGMTSPALFFFTINYLVIPPEEKLMEKTFGDDYLNYKNKVRKWI